MMETQSLVLCLPCFGWEDFPSHYRGAEADQVLTGWTGLWHPSLVSWSRQVPEIRHPDTIAATRPAVVVIPSLADLPAEVGGAKRGEDEVGGGRQAIHLAQAEPRDVWVAELIRRLGTDGRVPESDLVQAFYALGFATLQIQLLTRQMRYACSLDEERFRSTVVDGAEAACAGEADRAMDQVRAAFDMLAQERDHYYPVDVHLINLVLTDPSLPFSHVMREISQKDVAQNLLVTSRLVADWSVRAESFVPVLQERIRNGSLSCIGGEPAEARLPLWPAEAVVSHFLDGQAEFERLLGVRPTIFGRRRFGLSPTLPQILHQLGYQGVLHFTLEEGQFPQPYQAKSTWQGTAHATIDALSKLPADAAQPETFLYLANQLSQSMDGDHVATAILAHWPGHSASWMSDLQTAVRIHPVLGQFVTLADYFEPGHHYGHHDQFEADAYRSPYLAQDLAARRNDPVSSTIALWDEHRSQREQEQLRCLRQVVSRTLDDDPPRTRVEEYGALLAVLHATDHEPNRPSGWMVLNPWIHPRRLLVELPEFQGDNFDGDDVGDYVVASGWQEERFCAVVDVPAGGFSWLPARGNGTADESPPVGAGQSLQNEFMRLSVDPRTGGIASLRDYVHRDNLLSQQLTYRCVEGASAEATYARMVADSVTCETRGPVVGRIVSRGKILDREGRSLAGFSQQLTLHRGSRVAWIDWEMAPETACPDEPWSDAFVARWAWHQAGASLYRDLHSVRHATQRRRLEAPGYLELDLPQLRLTLINHGLAYHQQMQENRLDTLLMVGREQARRFRMGLGIDLAYPWHEYPNHGLAAPLLPCTRPPQFTRGWLLRVDARNVMASGMRPVDDGHGSCRGLRVRLLETEGRTVTARLQCCREFVEARAVDFRGTSSATLRCEDGHVVVNLGSREWIEVEAFWT